MATNMTTPTIQNADQEAAELAATFDSLAFMSGLDNADSSWVRDTGISVQHLLALKARGIISSEFEMWYPYLQEHLWGVRFNPLELVIRNAPREVRLELVKVNGTHTLGGHLPEILVHLASHEIGMKMIPSNGREIYVSEIAVPFAMQSYLMDHLLPRAEELFGLGPCNIHVFEHIRLA